MPKIVPPPDPTVKEEPGAQIARWLGPVGGGFVLLLSVLMIVFCLTRGANPVPGYTPPHDSEYYAQHGVGKGIRARARRGAEVLRRGALYI